MKKEDEKLGPLKTIKQKFEVMQELTLMVGAGRAYGLMVRGPGGVGKSHSVVRILEERQISYSLLRGYASPVAFYNFLYANRENLILIDDCDEVFGDVSGLNLLKAVLETTLVRRVSWLSPSPLVSVQSFEFTGRIIFLTNLSLGRLNNHFQAMLSRVHVFSLEPTVQEMLAYVRDLALHREYKETTREQRLMSVRFLRDNLDEFPRLNIRHYIKLLDIMLHTRKWRDVFMGCMR